MGEEAAGRPGVALDEGGNRTGVPVAVAVDQDASLPVETAIDGDRLPGSPNLGERLRAHVSACHCLDFGGEALVTRMFRLRREP